MTFRDSEETPNTYFSAYQILSFHPYYMQFLKARKMCWKINLANFIYDFATS